METVTTKTRNPKEGIEFEELSNKIIGAAIKVHKTLGPGFLESIYQTALPTELRKQDLAVESQREVKVYYDDQKVGVHRLDLVVNNQIIIELKAVNELNEAYMAQLLSYLKATGLKIGLLLNFAKPTLDIKRVVN